VEGSIPPHQFPQVAFPSIQEHAMPYPKGFSRPTFVSFIADDRGTTFPEDREFQLQLQAQHRPVSARRIPKPQE
jgi:hypothetical protein